MKLFAASTAALVLCASPAFAVRTSSPRDALASAARYADCIVKKRPELARAVVLDDLHKMKKQYRNLLDPSCLKAKTASEYVEQMSFPGDTFHEVLANALVRAEFANSGPVDFSAVPASVARTFQRATEATLTGLSADARQRRVEAEEKMLTWIFLSQVGECVARRSPDEVRRLALTDIASPVEKGLLKTLLPDVQACVPAGTSFRIQPYNLRGPLVRAYYKLARQAIDGSLVSAEAAR